jgi:galactonate dehydratase
MSANSLRARNLNVPLYELLGGQVRHKCQVYCWIGGDRPSDIEAAAYVTLAEIRIWHDR